MGAKQVRYGKLYTNKNGGGVRFRKQPLRNDVCPCGSGLKYKKCHLGNFDKLLELLATKK